MAAGAAPLGILAGMGTLPRRVAEAARGQGRRVFIIAFDGQADPSTTAGFDHAWVRLGQAGRTIAELKAAGIVDVVMAGGIKRPSLTELGLDLRGTQIIARIARRALGDDSLLRAVSAELEREGFRLLGAHEILTESLARTAGPLGGVAPDDTALADIARGVAVARLLGQADVGQSVVTQQGMVLGVEAIEGTDGLLSRVGSLRRPGLGGVLVKISKPGQDRRLDLPTIGLDTIARAAAAGLRGVAVEAGGVIILDRGEAIAAADAAGLFLVAIDAAGPI